MDENTQTIEPRLAGSGEMLDIIKSWPTIQGEGPFAGTPAVFLRLAGCNLQCSYCDTNYTTGRQSLAIGVILNEAIKHAAGVRRLLVITGGEPYRQRIAPLITAAIKLGFVVQVETNGTMSDPDVNMMAAQPMLPLTVVVSPKTPKMHPELIYHHLKYVVSNGEVDDADGLPTSVLGNGKKVARPPKGFKGDVYVQPMDEQSEIANRRHDWQAVQSCMKHGHRFCLQVHKYIGIE